MNDWKKDLLQKSNGYQMPLPDSLLGDITQEMARRGMAPVAQKVQRRSLRWLAAAAVLLLLVLSTAVLFLRQNGEQPAVAEQQTSQSSATSTLTPEEPQTIPQQIAHSMASVEHRISNGVAQLVAAVTNQPKTEEQPTPAGEPQPSQGQSATPQPYYPHESSQPDYSATEAPLIAKRSHSRLSLGVGYNAAFAAEMPSLGSDDNDNYMYDSGDPNPGGVPTHPTEPYYIPTNKAKHRQPLNVGITVRYQLSPRWSLHSGFTYSYLSSDFTTARGDRRTYTEQRLHYLGIPLGVSYSLWQNKHWNVYLGAGVEAQRLVKGKATTDKATKGQLESSTTTTLHDHRLLMSGNATAGVEYHLSPVIGLYLEPGLSRHFDNGSYIESSYTDKPWNVNLNMGLKIDIGKKK